MALQDDVAAVQATLATLTTDVQTLATDAAGTEPTTADTVLSSTVSTLTSAGLVSVFGTDPLVSALEADGYTVTAPSPNDTTDTPTA